MISAYLVEATDPRNPGNVLPERFLGFTGQLAMGARASGSFSWMTSVDYAIRFARRTDAEVFVAAMETLSYHLPHGITMAGLRQGDVRATVTEHSWDSDNDR